MPATQAPTPTRIAMRQPRPQRRIEPQLEKKIRLLHKDHRGALGSRGFAKALKIQGVVVGRLETQRRNAVGPTPVCSQALGAE